jgi:hypothetical protein
MQLNYSYCGFENNLLTNRMGDPWCGEETMDSVCHVLVGLETRKDIDKDVR